MNKYQDQIVDWRDVYSVSIPHIDEHHQRLFIILNRTYAADIHQDLEELKHSLEELKDYADVHFKAEEAVMKSKGLDEHFIKDHAHEHESFVRLINEFDKSLSQDGINKVSRNMVIFLVDWLATHIMVKDKKMEDLINESTRNS